MIGVIITTYERSSYSYAINYGKRFIVAVCALITTVV